MKPQKLTQDEIELIAQLGSPLLAMLAKWTDSRMTCAHCKKCTLRCEVLTDPELDVGLVEEAYQQIIALEPAEQPVATLEMVEDYPELYNALRRCCFCGFCTALCQTHMLSSDRMRDWRVLFMEAGLMPPEDSRIVAVDDEWHIFNAYRAIWGISYPEFTSLADAAEQGPGLADTLFFPGCSLVSYAPELTRAVGRWLSGAGIAWALSDDCCGSPLLSAGLEDRARVLQQRILDQMRAAGITRMVTVCPGCGEDFAEMMHGEIDIVPLPELLLQHGVVAFAAGGSTPPEVESITVFDSCHDRFDNRHGTAIRELMARHLPNAVQHEMENSGKGTLCCGAGGAVASYDEEITQRRVWRVIDEARSTGADTLVTMCPTCTYTIAQACLGAEPARGIDSHHYLELLFGQAIDWPLVFGQLESMWTGEYGPWLNETFFS